VGVIAVLSGGVGAARLLRALSDVVDPSTLHAIVNVGDDLELHGLCICPDLDTITYTLAGLNNDELGWGLRGESWRVMEELTALGGESWFRLGDRDLATHLYRTERLRNGATKSLVTAELATHHGIRVHLVPATNDIVATTFETAVGHLTFQEYFVQQHHNVVVTSINYEGAATSAPAPGVVETLRDASRIVIAPSNPLISVEPILQIPGIRDVLRERRNDVIAVSPIIKGSALKGPADRLLRELGFDASCVGVAAYYRDIVGTIVIDKADNDRRQEIEALGLQVRVTATIMHNDENSNLLATTVVA
jgi:LPPG:FO 2-phospho-L-lactate transferase